MTKITITDESSGLTVTIEGPKTEALEVFDAVQAAMRTDTTIQTGELERPIELFDPWWVCMPRIPYLIPAGNAKIIYKDEPILEQRRQKAFKE